MARGYQLDLMTPGSFPSEAIFRKQMRQMPNLRMYALGRPQIGQRLYALTPNLGFFLAFILSAVLAKTVLLIENDTKYSLYA